MFIIICDGFMAHYPPPPLGPPSCGPVTWGLGFVVYIRFMEGIKWIIVFIEMLYMVNRRFQ